MLGMQEMEAGFRIQPEQGNVARSAASMPRVPEAGAEDQTAPLDFEALDATLLAPGRRFPLSTGRQSKGNERKRKGKDCVLAWQPGPACGRETTASRAQFFAPCLTW